MYATVSRVPVRIDDGEREAEDRLLAAEGRDHLRVRVELDAEAPTGPGSDRLAELRQPDRRRVAHPLAQTGHERFANQGVGRLLRVAHAEVDHFDPALLDAPGGLVQPHERVCGLPLENGETGMVRRYP